MAQPAGSRGTFSVLARTRRRGADRGGKLSGLLAVDQRDQVRIPRGGVQVQVSVFRDCGGRGVRLGSGGGVAVHRTQHTAGAGERLCAAGEQRAQNGDGEEDKFRSTVRIEKSRPGVEQHHDGKGSA